MSYDNHLMELSRGLVGPDQIIIATSSLYRKYATLRSGEQRHLSDTDGIRGDLALELFQKAASRAVVCDGGSSSDFLSALEKFQNQGLTVVRSTVPGRGPQKRCAFEAAALESNCSVIVYTQPEKASLVNYLTEVSSPILEDKADIVIPKRNLDLFIQSYPEYMRQSELKVNATYDWLMKRENLMRENESFDWFFGPVAFRNTPKVLSLFLKQYEVDKSITSRTGAQINPEMHSDGHYFPIIEALFNGLRVVSVEIPFVYPPMQKANETSPELIEDFKKRRALDAVAYRLEAVHFLSFLRGDSRSKIKEA